MLGTTICWLDEMSLISKEIEKHEEGRVRACWRTIDDIECAKYEGGGEEEEKHIL